MEVKTPVLTEEGGFMEGIHGKIPLRQNNFCKRPLSLHALRPFAEVVVK